MSLPRLLRHRGNSLLHTGGHGPRASSCFKLPASQWSSRHQYDRSTRKRKVPGHTPFSTSDGPRKSQPSAPEDPALVPPSNLPQPYKPPTTGLLSYLPASVVPYAELIRLDKPVGTYYLFFPCLFSTLLAAPLTTPMTPPLTIVGTSFLFFSGALLMRGAGCAVNDFWDRKLDPHVTRTMHRPLARGAITPAAAVKYIIGLHLTAFGVLLQFPPMCLAYGIPSLLLVTTYPLAKRVTYYPQAVLGLTFSWGAMMGFPALGVDLLSNGPALAAATCLYASNVAWTVLYDMIYAHMDIKDDVKAGIKSIALAHETNTKAVLTGLAVTQIGLLAAAGTAVGAGPVFFLGTCGSAAATLGVMIWRVQLTNVKNCWWWFRNGAWLTGGGIALGLAGEYVAKLLGWEKETDATSKEERKVLVPAWKWLAEQYTSYRDDRPGM